MDQETREKAITAAYEAVTVGDGYMGGLHRDDTYGDDYEILSEGAGPLGAVVDCWVNFEAIVDAVVDVMEARSEDREDEAEDDGTRIPFRVFTQDGLVDASVSKVDVERYFRNIPSGARDDAAKHGFKTGGVMMTADEVEAAVERALRRQQSKGQHPSNGGK